MESPFEQVVHQVILGTKEFCERVKEKITWGRERGIPALRRLRRSLPVETVLEVMGLTCGVGPKEILHRGARIKIVRQMAMELCYRYCSLNQKELGEVFGVDYSTISQNRRRLTRRVQSDKRIRDQFEEIECKIENLSKRKI